MSIKKYNLSSLQKIVLSVIACIFTIFSIILVPIAFVLGSVVYIHNGYYDVMSKAVLNSRE